MYPVCSPCILFLYFRAVSVMTFLSSFYLMLLSTCILLCANKHGWMDGFLSRVSTLTRDIDIAILSVRPSVCPSVHNVPVLDENGLTCRHSFFHHMVAQSF